MVAPLRVTADATHAMTAIGDFTFAHRRNRDSMIIDFFFARRHFALDTLVCLSYIYANEAHFDVLVRAANCRAQEIVQAHGHQSIGIDSALHR